MSIVTHYIPKQSSSIILCFASAARKNPQDPYEFYKTCQETGYNILFIREISSWDYYTFYAELVDEVDQVFYSIPEEHRKNVYTVGLSSGGFGALAYGARYNALGIFAVSPQVNVSPAFYDSLSQYTTPEECGVLRCPLLNAQKNTITEVTRDTLETRVSSVRIVYAHLNTHDRAQVDLIRDARNLTLIPLYTSEHILSDFKNRILQECVILFKENAPS